MRFILGEGTHNSFHGIEKKSGTIAFAGYDAFFSFNNFTLTFDLLLLNFLSDKSA
jgi:hypothetical protein